MGFENTMKEEIIPLRQQKDNKPTTENSSSFSNKTLFFPPLRASLNPGDVILTTVWATDQGGKESPKQCRVTHAAASQKPG